jgi:hypothetical protein
LVNTESLSDPAVVTDIDVEKMLDDMASKSPKRVDWKTSIVDLLKLLRLDSSVTSRKVLFHELHCTEPERYDVDAPLAAPPSCEQGGGQWLQGTPRTQGPKHSHEANHPDVIDWISHTKLPFCLT